MASKTMLTASLEDEMHVYFASYEDLKERLEQLVMAHIDTPHILQSLLQLNDRMEAVLAAYERLGSSPPAGPGDLSSQAQPAALSSGSSSSGSNRPAFDADSDSPVDDSAISPQPSLSSESSSGLYTPELELSNTEPFECPICMDTVDCGHGYALLPCKHSYCADCLAEYCKGRIVEARVLEIHCPAPKCQTVLGYYDIKRVVDDALFGKYEEFTFVAALKSDPTARWCPNPKGCGNAVMVDTTFTKRVECDKCKFVFCFECMEDWHSGTCDDYARWKVENSTVDASFTKWASTAEVKKCPSCKMRIEKNDGCNHITCTNCRYNFCWLCDGRYTSNHYFVGNPFGCPGMQFKTNKKIPKAKIIAIRAGIGAGMVLSLPLLVTAAVVAGPVYGTYRLVRKIRRGY